jgi:excisionase family DNA binding protein
MSTLQLPISAESLFEPLLTSREAAPFLRLHYKTLEAMARSGAVPATKKGKSWMFRLSRLSEWIDQELESKTVCAKTAVGDHHECRDALKLVVKPS